MAPSSKEPISTRPYSATLRQLPTRYPTELGPVRTIKFYEQACTLGIEDKRLRKLHILLTLANAFELAPVDSSPYEEWQLRRMYSFGGVANFMGRFDEYS